MTEKGTLTQDDTEKAELLNTCFSSVFTREDESTKMTLEQREYTMPVNDMIITPDMVEKKLKKLKSTKSAKSPSQDITRNGPINQDTRNLEDGTHHTNPQEG